MTQRSGIFLACDTLPENPWSRDRIPAIRKALAGRRHVLTDIYDFGSEAQAHHVHRIRARNFFREGDLGEFNRVLVERVLRSGCRVAVLGTVDNFGHFLLPETLRVLRSEGVFTVGILGDDEFNFDHHWPWIFLFDRVVAYVKPVVERYNALRPGCCHYLPNSCHFTERDFDRLQLPETERPHGVSLFGSVFPARLRLVERLASAGLPLALFGGRGWQASPHLAPHYRGFVPSEAFDRTVRESKVVLALLEDHLTGAPHMNTKLWEAVRNGQLALTTRYAPLVDAYGLVEGRDIVFYDSPDDLAEKARHYLAHPQERRELARRLFHAILARFDYEDLYRGLFDRLEAEASEQETVRVVPPSPAVTLLGAPGVEDERAGFPVWRFTRTPGWRRRVAAEIGRQVRTPHVILTSGAFRYDPSLPALLHGGLPLPAGVVRLRSAGDNTTGWDTLLWRTDHFVATMLEGGPRDRLRARAAPLGFVRTILASRGPLHAGRSGAWSRADAWLARAGRAALIRLSKRSETPDTLISQKP
jgi:hypothetical protein